ncbi:hypothetical protein LEMLEM_LOCUS4259 [Lemmus lemmus]
MSSEWPAQDIGSPTESLGELENTVGARQPKIVPCEAVMLPTSLRSSILPHPHCTLDVTVSGTWTSR